MEMTRAEILQGRDFVEEILSHLGTQVQVKWASEQEPTWDTVKRLRDYIEPQLADYAFEKNLLETSGWKWAAKFTTESEMTDIVSHEGTGKDTKVLAYYDDGTKVPLPLKEVKKYAKDLLAKYCRQNKLEEEEGWKWVEKYWKKLKKQWFTSTQKLVANAQMLREHDRLTTALHTEYKRCWNTNDMESMVAFGQAFKKSIDMRKHGGKVPLPIHLHKRIKEKALKRYLSVED